VKDASAWDLRALPSLVRDTGKAGEVLGMARGSGGAPDIAFGYWLAVALVGIRGGRDPADFPYILHGGYLSCGVIA